MAPAGTRVSRRRADRRPVPPRPARGHVAAPDAQAHHRHGGRSRRRSRLQPRRRLRPAFRLDDAVFAANFSPNGLSGDYGGTFFWTRIGGTALARRLYLLNEKIPAPRALELGMVHAVVSPDRAPGLHRGGRRALARTPGPLLARVKDNLNEAEDEVARRRWLFAHEAEHQIGSGKRHTTACREAGQGTRRRAARSNAG